MVPAFAKSSYCLLEGCLLVSTFAAVTSSSATDPLGTTGGLSLGATAAAPFRTAALSSSVAGGTDHPTASASDSSADQNFAGFGAPTFASGNVEQSGTVGANMLGSALPSLARTPLQSSGASPGGDTALAIGASANAIQVPAFPHADFGPAATIVGDSAGVQGNPSFPSLEGASSRGSLVRREPQPGAPLLNSVPRTISSDATSREAGAGAEESEPRAPHKYAYQENPKFTPEAIFGNQHLAPDIAEFLGHLAQRTRVHRKESNRKAHEAGLVAQGRVSTSGTSDSEDNDDTDDIEDMKKAAMDRPKTTPLSYFFEHLDTKARASAWNPADCVMVAKNLTDRYARMKGRSMATWATTGPAGAAERSEIHTGMFFRHWNIGKTKDIARKLRLSVLSFLATQDAARVKLHIWTDVKRNDNTLKEMLGPIAHHPEFMDAINITTFDPKAEFAKVPPTLARETLTERYKQDTMPHLRPDLYRAIILYNYGGLWMDADTMLMQDVSPLLGEDWAYLVRGKEGAVEGALLSASKPKSHFTNEYLISMVMREPPIDLEMEQQKPLLVDVFGNDPAHTTLHVLPPCFLDADPLPEARDTAVLSSETSLGSPFFGKAAAETYHAFFAQGIEDAVQDNSTADVSVIQEPKPSADLEEEEEPSAPAAAPPTWAYHWRGNFAAAWARGSLADVAERTFMKKLQLKRK